MIIPAEETVVVGMNTATEGGGVPKADGAAVGGSYTHEKVTRILVTRKKTARCIHA